MKDLSINQWSNLKNNIHLDEQGKEYASISCFKKAIYEFEEPQDFRNFDCLSFDLYLSDVRAIELEFDIFPLSIGRKEYFEKTSANVSLVGKGWHHVQVAFDQFNYDHAVRAFWRFIDKIRFSYKYVSQQQVGEILVKNLRLQKIGHFSLSSPLYSKAGKVGDRITYEIEIENLLDKEQMIKVTQERYGIESMKTVIEPDVILVKPKSVEKTSILVEISEQIAPGGYEIQKLKFVPNGDASSAKDMELKTVRELPHPYILHTEGGWNEVKNKIANHEWAKDRLEEYIETADKWVVPEPHGKGYVFETNHRNNIMAATIAWKLTGKKEYADKVSLFLRRLADPHSGYESIETPLFFFIESYSEYDKGCPMMHMACNQGHVQEAEFFRDMAMCYDIIYDSGALTKQDHVNIEQTFRSYLSFIDWLLTDGDGNNFQICEVAAGLLCSMAIQDRDLMDRFLYGHNGFTDLLAAVILDDGWYFELATGYIMLAGELFTEIAQAALPWGINLKDLYVAPSYHRNIMHSPWSVKQQNKRFLGMSFERHGPNTTNYRTLRQFFDSMISFIDHRGLLFGMNDGREKEVHDIYERAYFLFREEKYVQIIKSAKKRRNLLYGVADLPNIPQLTKYPSVYADNAGLAVLRSQSDNCTADEQIQAVLKYGTHGGYHGHFDRISMLSMMRYGRSFYNPLATWYGYDSYLFKMWVQTSLSHNMVVVDQKMQEPTEAERLIFHSGKLFQACAVETNARWSDPPYGGQTPYPRLFPDEKGWDEGRSLPFSGARRKQGDIGEYSEPVRQRRLMIVTNDYVIVSDYLEGKTTHEYDCLFHLKGFKGINEKEATFLKHTGQFNTDQYGAGQFITNCNWYEMESPAVLHFEDEPENTEEPTLQLDLHRVWPKQGEVMIGNYPEEKNNNKKVTYQIFGDGELVKEGKSGIWILGKEQSDIDVSSLNELEIKVSIEENHQKPKTIFLADSYFLSSKGDKLYVSELSVEYDNVEQGNGIGHSYYGGLPCIEGTYDKHAIPFEPKDHNQPAILKINLEGLDVVRFVTAIGGDYPFRNNDQHRKTVSFRTVGEKANFISIIEPYKDQKMIKKINTINEETFAVELVDGRTQHVTITNFNSDRSNIHIEVIESLDHKVINEERTK